MTGLLGADKAADAVGNPDFTVKNGNLQYTIQASGDYGIITTKYVTVYIEDVTVTASGIAAVANIGANMEITDCTFSGGAPVGDQTVTLWNVAGGTMTFDGEIAPSANGQQKKHLRSCVLIRQ